jgi:hypothetical protein
LHDFARQDEGLDVFRRHDVRGPWDVADKRRFAKNRPHAERRDDPLAGAHLDGAGEHDIHLAAHLPGRLAPRLAGLDNDIALPRAQNSPDAEQAFRLRITQALKQRDGFERCLVHFLCEKIPKLVVVHVEFGNLACVVGKRAVEPLAGFDAVDMVGAETGEGRLRRPEIRFVFGQQHHRDLVHVVIVGEIWREAAVAEMLVQLCQCWRTRCEIEPAVLISRDLVGGAEEYRGDLALAWPTRQNKTRGHAHLFEFEVDERIEPEPFAILVGKIR